MINMKFYSKFNTERKGNQIVLTVTKGKGRETLGEAIVYMGDALTFTMDNPMLFEAFFNCKTLDDVIKVANDSGWAYETDEDSPLRTGEWKDD